MIPLIEVIVPCRNAPAALWLALTHLVAHADFPGLAEVTLLDNCSTAPEMRFVLGEARRRGCRVLRNEENVGVWTSVNRGLAVARASWVFVLTADVLLGPMAVSILAQVMDQAGPSLVHLGPVPVEGENAILAAPVLGDLPTTVTVNTSTYNGACFLLRWDELRQKVGWFDPSFFVCFGDTDYAERIRAAGLEYGVVPELPCIHLNKQSRRADHTVEQDSEIEVRDGARFREKWRDDPEVLARHPELSAEKYVELKGGAVGWEQEKSLF